jgi:hypothetical protein
MFPLLRNRAARALDVAIEFATLGEYRWEESPTRDAPARGANRRAVPAERRDGAPARPAARLVAPASAAARLAAVRGAATLPASARLRPVPVAGGAAIKQLALDFEGLVPAPPVRGRGGAAPPAPQPCKRPRR